MATRLYSVVIDCAQPAVLARWWSDAIGWPVTFEEPDEVVVEGDDDDVPALVFVPVADPKVGKNRVHLDLASDSIEHQAAIVARLVARGARPVDIGQGDVPWVVLADPEGNELCVLEPRDRHRGAGPLASIVVDAVDPSGLARFWEAAAGWDVVPGSGGAVTLRAPSGRLPDLDLVAVPEVKRTKNRWHLDVAPWPHDDRDVEVARLVASGASPRDVGQASDATWVVLADPEGNELCVLTPR